MSAPAQHALYRVFYCLDCDPSMAENRAESWDADDLPPVYESRYEVIVPIGETFGGTHVDATSGDEVECRIPEKGAVSCPFDECPRCGHPHSFMVEHYPVVVSSPAYDAAIAHWLAEREVKAT